MIGLKLAKAKAKIRKAHCRVGKIRKAFSNKPGRVLRQKPRPGVKKPNGFKVTLVVGRR